MKTKVHKADEEKLKTVLVDLSNLSNKVDNNDVKKIVCDRLVTKVKVIDTKIPSKKWLANKPQYDSDN